MPLTLDLTDYLQKGDNVSELTNDAGYITAADVYDGKITITDADGNPTVNSPNRQRHPITLPAIPVVEDQIHIGDTYPNVPELGDLWVDTTECPPVQTGTTGGAPQNMSYMLNPPHPFTPPQRHRPNGLHRRHHHLLHRFAAGGTPPCPTHVYNTTVLFKTACQHLCPASQRRRQDITCVVHVVDSESGQPIAHHNEADPSTPLKPDRRHAYPKLNVEEGGLHWNGNSC